MVANGHAGKDRCRTTDPDVGTKTNWRNPGRARRFQGMVVGVENGHQVPDQAIVTEYDAVIGHDRGTSVDEDTLAEHKGAIWASAHLDRYRLAAQEQTSARDRSSGEEHRCRPSTVTMADRAPAQRNTAVAQRLKGTSRTLITDHSPAGVRNSPRSLPNRRATTGVGRSLSSSRAMQPHS